MCIACYEHGSWLRTNNGLSLRFEGKPVVVGRVGRVAFAFAFVVGNVLRHLSVERLDEDLRHFRKASRYAVKGSDMYVVSNQELFFSLFLGSEDGGSG